MRKLAIVVLGLAALAFIADGAWARTIQLHTWLTPSQLKGVCAKYGGTYGTEENGAGVCTGKGGAGTVMCTKKGSCTGNCSNCRLVGNGGVAGVLNPPAGGLKQPTGGQVGTKTISMPTAGLKGIPRTNKQPAGGGLRH